MKITQVDVLPLTGDTVDGGWPQGHEPQENLHTLIEVHTDEGISGVGSSFTSGALVQGAVELLKPMLIGESGVEPERVSENLRQSSFWQGRGGAVEHAISGIDIALWDVMGMGGVVEVKSTKKNTCVPGVNAKNNDYTKCV